MYNPLAFRPNHPAQNHPSFLPNYLDLPGPSSYHTQGYISMQHNSSPTGSAGECGPDPGIGLGPGLGENEELVKLEDGDGAGEDGEEVIHGDGEGEGDVDSEEPLYVNAKQYHRILKRRAARQRLEELNRLARSRKVSRRASVRIQADSYIAIPP
jgi:hypothetical protein